MRFDAFRSITEPQTNKDFSLILELSTKEGTLENNYSNDSSLNNQMDAGTCFKSLRYASYLISASSPVRSGASNPFILFITASV